MKTKKQIKAFILKTLLPYKEDPTTCGYSGSGCLYLTEDGRKCAVGKWLKKGKWQDHSKWVTSLFKEFGTDILLKPARDMEFSTKNWKLIQNYHDGIALGSYEVELNTMVVELEEAFKVELPELRYEEL